MVNSRDTIKVIGVDVGGVIIPYLDDLIDEAIRVSLGLDKTKFYKLWKKDTIGLVKGTTLEKDFWDNIKTTTNKDPKCAKRILKDNYINNLIMNGEFIAYLRTISIKFKIVAMSNSIKTHSDFNYKNAVYDAFDELYLSNEMGLKKPDINYFNHVIKKLEIEPWQLLFIDDNATNIKVARKIGIRTIHFKYNSQTIKIINRLIS